MLTSLTLKRFRSFPAGTIHFANPTFLVGSNGCGKSNLADAFAFLAEAMASPLPAVIARRGGFSAVGNRTSPKGRPAALGLRAVVDSPDFSATYAFEVRAAAAGGLKVLGEQCKVRPGNGPSHWFDRDADGFRSNAGSLAPAIEQSALALPLVGGDTRFGKVFEFLSGMRTCRIEPAALRDMQDPDEGSRLSPDGQNAASVLREIRRASGTDWETLLEMLRHVVPGTTAVSPKPQGNKLGLEFDQDWGLDKPVRFHSFSMSDGTLRTLGLLAAVFQRSRPSVLVIEEPEATVHAGALGAILDLLRIASRRMQVVVTTHSADLLDAKWVEGQHLRVLSWSEGASRVGTLSESARSVARDHLMRPGEMLRANVLTPEPGLDVPSADPFRDSGHDLPRWPPPSWVDPA